MYILQSVQRDDEVIVERVGHFTVILDVGGLGRCRLLIQPQKPRFSAIFLSRFKWRSVPMRVSLT